MIIPEAEVLRDWIVAANAGDARARDRLLRVAYQILREHFHDIDDGDELAHCAVLKVADCPKLLTFELRTRDAYQRWS
ncbi:MAG: hypothetical protein HC927_04945 [Deltaproteobacteria bacterium]|nr:hypothetical protein [Deltaproteobacteria bacterium]